MLRRIRGDSPAQWALATRPRVPESLMIDDENVHHVPHKDTPESQDDEFVVQFVSEMQQNDRFCMSALTAKGRSCGWSPEAATVVSQVGQGRYYIDNRWTSLQTSSRTAVTCRGARTTCPKGYPSRSTRTPRATSTTKSINQWNLWSSPPPFMPPRPPQQDEEWTRRPHFEVPAREPMPAAEPNSDANDEPMGDP